MLLYTSMRRHSLFLMVVTCVKLSWYYAIIAEPTHYTNCCSHLVPAFFLFLFISLLCFFQEVLKIIKDLRRSSGFDPITFTFSKKFNYGREKCKGKSLLDLVNKLLNTKKFGDNAQQCFAFLPQANFPAHNLNFHWRWRWWDWLLTTF